jgi:hypothetical protein
MNDSGFLFWFGPLLALSQHEGRCRSCVLCGECEKGEWRGWESETNKGMDVVVKDDGVSLYLRRRHT